jgi:hypothetical protein
MKNCLLIFLLSFSLILSISAQSEEAQLIDGFGILPCGDFSNRMGLLLYEHQKNPESEIYIVYYGARYRRELVDYDKRKNKFTKIKLSSPHRDDALNRAKSIPLYLANYPGFPENLRNSIKDKIKLVDSGFRENIEFEIWLVPKGANPPKPSPLIEEKYIKFSKGKPYPTYNYACCYEAC